MASPYLTPFRHAYRHPGFRKQFIASAVFLAIVLFVLTRFLEAIERRPGIILPDPLLMLFQPMNLTWLTFLLVYAGLIAAFIVLLRYPYHFMHGMQTYAFLVLVRMAAMYLVPLDPPPGHIELKDPLVEFFGGGRTLSRDLFFSGHTATLFLLALIVPVRPLKIAYLIGTAAVAMCVILQHVHYTIDVFAALFFAYGCYHMLQGARGPETKAWMTTT